MIRTTVTVRVTDIMRDLRGDIVPTESKRASYLRTLEHSSGMLSEFGSLDALVESVRAGATQVGSMPAVPNTMRGRFGSKLVAVVHRCLFWYTPQLHAFHLKLLAVLDEQASATQALAEELREVRAQLEALKRSADRPSEDSAKEPARSSSQAKESGWQK